MCKHEKPEDQLRLPYRTDDVVRIGRRDVLHQSDEAASA